MDNSIKLMLATLTNDQLVGLAQLTVAEAASRSDVVAQAVHAAMLTEAEKAQIGRTAALAEAERLRRLEEERVAQDAVNKVRIDAERKLQVEEAEKQRSQWATRKSLAQWFQGIFGIDNGTIKVWGKDGEVRIYMDAGGGRKVVAVRVEYYHTGNPYKPAGTLVVSGNAAEGGDVGAAQKVGLKLLCDRLIKIAPVGYSCDVAAGLAAAEEPNKPIPAEILAVEEARLAEFKKSAGKMGSNPIIAAGIGTKLDDYSELAGGHYSAERAKEDWSGTPFVVFRSTTYTDEITIVPVRIVGKQWQEWGSRLSSKIRSKEALAKIVGQETWEQLQAQTEALTYEQIAQKIGIEVAQ